MIPGLGRSLKKEMATYSSILAWDIPWTEEPGGLQSMGSQRVGHDPIDQRAIIPLCSEGVILVNQLETKESPECVL